jgi:hypothetical protein
MFNQIRIGNHNVMQNVNYSEKIISIPVNSFSKYVHRVSQSNTSVDKKNFQSHILAYSGQIPASTVVEGKDAKINAAKTNAAKVKDANCNNPKNTELLCEVVYVQACIAKKKEVAQADENTCEYLKAICPNK